MKFDFRNKSDQLLSGNLELPKEGGPKAFALFAHCFTCSKDFVAARTIARTLTNSGIGVLRFDFTGLGNSQGDFSNTNFSTNVEDLLAAYEAIEKEYMAPSMIIGHSLGGAAVLKAGTLIKNLKAVVTIGAPSDVSHVKHLFQCGLETIEEKGEAEVDLSGRTFLVKKQFVEDLDSTQILPSIKELKTALLVMHSPIDNTVSIDHAAEIYTSARHPKSFISLDSADHLLMNKKDAQYAADVIGAWANRYL